MPSLSSAVAALFVLPAVISAYSFECEHVLTGGQSFHFKKLGGPKTVHSMDKDPPNIHNTTFTIDICKPLKFSKSVPKDERCDHGTRICGIDTEYRAGHDPFVSRVIPIAGEYTTSHGRHLDPDLTRLNGSQSNSDSNKEGVRVELHGGMYNGNKQRAIIEFLCDPELEGNEGFDDEEEGNEKLERRREKNGEGDDKEGDGEDEDGDDDDGDDAGPSLPDFDKGKALQLVGYKPETDENIGTLRLTWKTRYACEGETEKEPEDDSDPDKKSTGWGFFTWFLIVVFLLAAAYIIFGSWLNYNRYGARGWDLIPHGDTIRDLPYLIKDWVSSLTEKFRGSSSRGGYSAV